MLVARRVLALLIALSLAAVAVAEPRPGGAVPPFRVDDLEGTHHTERDLLGAYTVVCAMSDSDVGPALAAWWRALEGAAPRGTRMLTFSALDLFALIPTATVRAQARSRTPRTQWRMVWLSRDGSLAAQLGLPESEVPWVFVVAPDGRVVASAHAALNPADLARLVAALPPTPR